MFIHRLPFISIYFDETAPVNTDVKPDVKVDPKPNLTKVIEDATIQVGKDIPLEETKPEVKDEKTTTTDDKKDDKKDELNQEQLDVAKNLFKALNNPDPNIQKQAVELLATAAGLKLEKVETKKEIVEAKKDLIELLKAGLGEYDFLADKLGPVLKQVITEMVAEQTKETKEEVNKIRDEKTRNEIVTSIDTAFAKFENAIELKDEVLKLMDQITRTSKMSNTEYFESLIAIAAQRKGTTLKVPGSKQTVNKDKVNKTRNDVASRVASERGPEPKLGVRTPGKMKVDDAVRDAIESLASKT